MEGMSDWMVSLSKWEKLIARRTALTVSSAVAVLIFSVAATVSSRIQTL
jgi:hypothetical protein